MIHDMSNIRKEIAARLGFAAKAKFAENTIYHVAAHIGNDPVGERTARSLDEAKAYAKAMLEAHKANAKGKPVVVDVYPVVNYEPKPAVLTLRASRPGAKAEMANEVSIESVNQLYDRVMPIIHDMNQFVSLSIPRVQSSLKDAAKLANRAAAFGEKILKDRVASPEMLRELDRMVSVVRAGYGYRITQRGASFSRPGAKAKFAADANYARMDIRYVLPNGSEETEMMSGSVRGAIASANKAAVHRGDGTKVYIKAHIPGGGRLRLPARTEIVYKGEVINGELYERGGMFSRPGAKARMGRVSQSQVSKILASVESDIRSLYAAARKQDSSAMQQFAGQAISSLSTLENGEFSRPGAKALTRKAN